ncbi:IclR family transcriptional regulator [Telmatospirillum sp.]|uniref:IclR family transcriptional regulator n=1 Tax=Telmatospirillum sp. TaxID=2079197 RepID=UPI00284CA7B1|nr:IclR family transcriptional regulator [Telmatospirillum sp.]MDR3437802.1 IclR family transcriptional regulator [Telmatospirillum sp.]
MRVVKNLLDRCVEVVELMALSPMPRGVSEISATLDLPKTAAYRLLRKLCDLGWVEQVGEDGPYRLTLRLALLGNSLLLASGLTQTAQPLLDRLAEGTRELVRLTVANERGLSWAAFAQGAPPGIRYQPSISGAVVLHATASGKAFLAALPEPQALEMARGQGLGKQRPGPRTVASEDELRRDLALIRQQGYAVIDEEAEPEIKAVAVAIRQKDGPPLGTLSVAGPRSRLSDERIPGHVKLLTETAQILAAGWFHWNTQQVQ